MVKLPWSFLDDSWDICCSDICAGQEPRKASAETVVKKERRKTAEAPCHFFLLSFFEALYNPVKAGNKRSE